MGIQSFIGQFNIRKGTADYISATLALKANEILNLAKTNGLVFIGQGQNRLVFEDPQVPSIVYKVAYSPQQGCYDNFAEKLISDTITANPVDMGVLRDKLTISYDITPDHGILSQEKVSDIRAIMPGNPNGKDSLGLMLDPANYQAYLLIVMELSKHFLLFDVHIKNPYNFGVRMVNGQPKMVLLDYGYLLPLAALNQTYIPCPECNSGMTYTVPVVNEANINVMLNDIMNPDKPAVHNEQYICSRCGHVSLTSDLLAKYAAGKR